MRKLMLSTVAGFLITGIFILTIARMDAFHIFIYHAAQASRGAFSEIFHAGNSEHMAAEISLTENSRGVSDVRSGRVPGLASSTTLPMVKQKTAKIPQNNTATSPANKIKPAVKVTTLPPIASAEEIAALKVSEIMAGASSSPSDEFIELINLGKVSVDMTGWSIKKKSASGAESTLVSANRFAGKIILPHGYFLLANSGGWMGAPTPDVLWPASYSLSYTSNTIVLYAPGNILADSVSWSEIPSGKSYARDPITGKLSIQNVPTPQNNAK